MTRAVPDKDDSRPPRTASKEKAALRRMPLGIMTPKQWCKNRFPSSFARLRRTRNQLLAAVPPLATLLKVGGGLSPERPWLNRAAIEWLQRNLRPDMEVFEYGSGGSTVFMSEKTRRVYSVESDIYWYLKVRRTLRARSISNCTLLFAAADLPDAMQGKNPGAYETYAGKIDRFPSRFFDLAFIDGRGREACARHGLSKVKKGGYILLDNSEREEYLPIKGMLRDYESSVLTSSEMPNQTTVWKID